MPLDYHLAAVAQIDPLVLYRILWLRVGVFVVEQEAAYPEIDGRDIEPGAELLWAEEGEEVVSTLRVLSETSAMRIGRVATAPSARGRGVAAELMRRAVQRCEERAPGMPIVLDAQAQLEGWYARFGFVVSGDPFAEDGIPHLPMRRG
ncbi:GNAT family N-acetyltransferase [Microbacterium sp. P06]|uniref:GNAT family N-acetyltransferase n=1 Tax=unclassified Microbacterium TaxID=2609290 RepID=UPI003746083E